MIFKEVEEVLIVQWITKGTQGQTILMICQCPRGQWTWNTVILDLPWNQYQTVVILESGPILTSTNTCLVLLVIFEEVEEEEVQSICQQEVNDSQSFEMMMINIIAKEGRLEDSRRQLNIHHVTYLRRLKGQVKDPLNIHHGT